MKQAVKRFDRRSAAIFLSENGFPIEASTLAKYASIGGGPTFSHWGRKPLYAEPDLLRWAETRCSASKKSTSDRRGAV